MPCYRIFRFYWWGARAAQKLTAWLVQARCLQAAAACFSVRGEWARACALQIASLSRLIMRHTLRALMIVPPLSCRFMVAWVFLVLLGAFITCLPRYGLHSSRPFWSGMFTVTALLFMIASEAMLAA